MSAEKFILKNLQDAISATRTNLAQVERMQRYCSDGLEIAENVLGEHCDRLAAIVNCLESLCRRLEAATVIAVEPTPDQRCHDGTDGIDGMTAG